MFLTDLIKSRKVDKLIGRKDKKSNEEIAEFLAIIETIKELGKETPEISLPRLSLPDIQGDQKVRRRVIIMPPRVLYKGAALALSLLLVFSLYSFYTAKEQTLAGLNKQAIAKELEEISNNAPGKSIAIENRVREIISPEKDKGKLEGLNQEQINSEIKKIAAKPKQTNEVDDLIQSYGK